MGKENQSSAMEVDDPKSTNSDQIVPKFSITGSCLLLLSTNTMPFLLLLIKKCIISVIKLLRLM